MTKEEIEKNINSIRNELDKRVNSSDIQGVENNLIALQSLSGLCAEVVKNTEKQFLVLQGNFLNIEHKNYSAKNLEGIVKGKLAEELTQHNYAKSLLEAIRHKSDALRTTISLYKTEIESNLRQSNKSKS